MNQFWFSFLARNLPIPGHSAFGKTPRAISGSQFTRSILTRKQFGLGKTGRPILVFEFYPKNHHRKQFGLVTVAALWPNHSLTHAENTDCLRI